MKYVVFFLFLFYGSVYSQEHAVSQFGQAFIANGIDALNYRLAANIEGIDGFDKVNNDVVGSPLLFKKWENDGEVYIDDKKFIFKSINFHVANDVFLFKINKDSIFEFNATKLKKIIINNRAFKYIYNPLERKNEVFEIVAGLKKNGLLLKKHYIEILPKSDIPMVNRPSDVIQKKAKYFLLNANGDLVSLRLRKKELFSLFENDKLKAIKEFIKEHKLSIKKDKDLKKIFEFNDSL